MTKYLCNLCLIVVTGLVFSAYAQAQTLAFPGAEGFGKFSKGGRGGKICRVENLNDSGPGSFRTCLEMSGPRTVVFRVGGTIVAKTTLAITNPYITIAGQSAPGGGITLRNDPSNTSATLHIKTHDVVVRHIRVRSGPSTELACCLGAINISYNKGPVYNVILDHVSASWATDQVLTTWYNTYDVTIQRSIIAEGLHNSTHEKGRHSKGFSLGGTGRISVIKNLFIHNVERNPLVSGRGSAVGGKDVDIINNIVYNPGAYIMAYDNDISVNVMNNLFVKGPSTDPDEYHVRLWEVYGQGAKIYVKGNIGPKRPTTEFPDDALVYPQSRTYLVNSPGGNGNYPLLNSDELFVSLLDDVGTTVPKRDAVDVRLIGDVRNKTGRHIDDPSQVGGWPVLEAGTPPRDSDGDGIPDSWELANGLKPNDAVDGAQDRDGDGYTNVEEYLNSLVASTGGSTVPNSPGNLVVVPY